MDPPTASSSFFPDGLEEESDMEYETVPPPASIERSRVSDILDQAHEARFCGAVMNILHSKPAEFTFAQLVDGLPLAKVALASKALRYEEPVTEHEQLCPGAMDKVRAFRDSFNPASLDLPVEVLRRYQDIPAGSRASKLPLIELVVVAVHRLAVLVHREDSLHKEKDPTFDEGRPFQKRHHGSKHKDYYPTPFCLIHYSDPAQFPDGVADLAGYWAENWIFGGVVVFSRGENGKEVSQDFSSATRKGCATQIWLTDGIDMENSATMCGYTRAERTPQIVFGPCQKTKYQGS